MAIDFKSSFFSVESLKKIVGEDKVLMLSLVDNILKGNEEMVTKMFSNYNAEAWNSVKGNAHFLKSNFRYLGNEHMTEILRSIEYAATDERLRSGIAPMLADFKSVYPSLMDELRAFKHYLES